MKHARLILMVGLAMLSTLGTATAEEGEIRVIIPNDLMVAQIEYDSGEIFYDRFIFQKIPEGKDIGIRFDLDLYVIDETFDSFDFSIGPAVRFGPAKNFNFSLTAGPRFSWLNHTDLRMTHLDLRAELYGILGEKTEFFTFWDYGHGLKDDVFTGDLGRFPSNLFWQNQFTHGNFGVNVEGFWVEDWGHTRITLGPVLQFKSPGGHLSFQVLPGYNLRKDGYSVTDDWYVRFSCLVFHF